ncbi:MAG: glycosyltransferase family 2 protein [Pseudomonadota bacterium]
MAASPKYVLISMMRDEAPYILDWVAHHRALGFEHFVVFHNDCTDNTVQILERIATQGYMTVRKNRHGPGGLQRTALRMARDIPEVQGAEWIWICDADEYLNIHAGDHRVEDLITSVPGDSDSIAVPWRNFSSNGHVQVSDARMPVAFTDAAPPLNGTRNRLQPCKSLSRNIHKYKRLGTHQPIPNEEHIDDYKRVMPGGIEIVSSDDYLKHARFDVAQVNHYAVRSLDGFLIKKSRMRVNHAGSVDTSYFARLGLGGHHDDSIHRYEPMKEPFWEEFRADERLMYMQRRAIRHHRLRGISLREEEGFADVHEEIKKIAASVPPAKPPS